MNQAQAPRLWTAAEDARLIARHPNREALIAALPHRTWHAIRNRARAVCGGTNRKFWTTTEDRTLRRMMKDGASIHELCKAIPGRTKKAICARRFMYGGAPPRRMVSMDGGALDAVKARAFARGINMQELDRLSGSGTYFYKGQSWFVLKHVAKAAEALGGWIDVEWEPLD